jgi:CheY-like chemotaxis protein
MPKELESQVRQALIDERAEGLYQMYSSSDKPKETLEDISRELVDSVVEGYKRHERESNDPLDEEDIEDFRRECEESFQAQVSQMLDPDQLRETARQQAEREYMPEEGYRAEIQAQIEEAKKDGEVDDNALAKYAESHEILFGLVRNRERMVKRLVEIAEKKGLEKATQKETRYAVIRELFPTREDYKAFQESITEKLEKFYLQAGDALMQDGEMGKLAGRIMSNMATVMPKIREKFKDMETEFLEKELDAIYGIKMSEDQPQTKRVLIVEDHSPLPTELIRMLREIGMYEYKFRVAQNGEEGAQAIEEYELDLVFTDLSMPVKNGVYVMKAANQRDIPVILMTAKGPDTAIYQEAVAQKPVAILTKPFVEDDVRKVIRHAFDPSKPLDEQV